MSNTQRHGWSVHLLRSTLIVAGILLIGAVLGVGALKAYHKIRGTSGATSGAIAQASAGYGLSAPTSVTVADRDLFIANQARQLGECGRRLDRRPCGDHRGVIVQSR